MLLIKNNAGAYDFSNKLLLACYDVKNTLDFKNLSLNFVRYGEMRMFVSLLTSNRTDYTLGEDIFSLTVVKGDVALFRF